jgi:transcriptional regulator with XRE-family HTH domain
MKGRHTPNPAADRPAKAPRATVRPADFRQRRLAAGLTMRTAAAGIGISDGMVAHVEQGHRNLTLDRIVTAARLMGCRPSDIADIDAAAALEQLAEIAEAIR